MSETNTLPIQRAKSKKVKLPSAWYPLRRHNDAPPDCECGLCTQRRLAQTAIAYFYPERYPGVEGKRFILIAAGRQSGKCLVENTSITMADGRVIPIQNVKPGDYVSSLNLDTYKKETCLVSNLINNGRKSVIKITTKGRSITCTKNHKILSYPYCWVESSKLKVGDFIAILLDELVQWERITKIESVGNQNTYDLSVEKHHNFIAEGIVVHNSEQSKRFLVSQLPVKKPWPNPRYFYAAPTYQQARDIAWEDFKNLVPSEWVAKRGINESSLRIKTIFDSTLYLFGLDRPHRVEGYPGGFDMGIVDESSDIKPKTVELSIIPQLTWRKGVLWRIGVPKRFGVGALEFKKAFLKAMRGESPGTAAFSWSATDVIPQETLEWAKSEMTPQDYNEQFLAQWQDAGGGVFYSFQEEFNVRRCDLNPNLPILVGSDFNVDPMAWVLCHKTGERRLEQFDEIWVRNTNTQKTLDMLWAKYGHHKAGFQFYGDASGKARKTSASQSDYLIIANDERFKGVGRTIHYLNSNPPIHDRFAACNVLMRNAKEEINFFVDPSCRKSIDDYTSRSYKPGTNELPNDEGDLGHASDATGYIIFKLFPLTMQGIAAPTVTITSNPIVRAGNY